MTNAELFRRLDALTETCTNLLAEIRRTNHETLSVAVADFGRVNRERIALGRMLNRLPAEG